MGWQVPDDIRAKIVKRLAGVVNPATKEGKRAELRYVIQAARTLASADLRQQALDLAVRQAEADKTAGTLAELTEEAERRAVERRSARATDEPPS